MSLDEAWDFFSSPRNLNEITPDDMVFEILSDLPEKMYEGMFIRYRLKPMLNIPVQWCTEITHIRDRAFFVDEQRKGPYSIWHHEHHFRAVPGGVEMEDTVHYALPFGWLGRWVAGPWVDRQLQGIFDFRRKALESRFPGPFHGSMA